MAEKSATREPLVFTKAHQDQGYTAVLVPYKSWDNKPVDVEPGEAEGDLPRLKPFEWTTAGELGAFSLHDATPGEFDLLDARMLMN